MSRKIIPLLFLIIFSSSLISVHSQSLVLTIGTDQSSYYFTSDIKISGQVKVDGNPKTDATVNVLVTDSNGVIVLARTVNTGTPITTPLVSVSNAQLCDDGGNPQSSVAAGQKAYVTADVVNNDVNPETCTVIFYMVDQDYQVLGTASSTTTLSQRGDHSFPILGIDVPSYSVTGSGTIFANVITGMANQNGYPLCKEISASFSLTNGKTPKGYNPVSVSQGTYQASFKLPKSSREGTYNVYTCTKYIGQTLTAASTFSAILLGDLNFDSKVDYNDILIFVNDYIKFQQIPPIYTQNVDFNNDHSINYQDILLFVNSYLNGN